METVINNRIQELITVYVDNIGHDLILLKDGKLIDVIGNSIIVYENEDDFMNNNFPMGNSENCNILTFADINHDGDNIA